MNSGSELSVTLKTCDSNAAQQLSAALDLHPVIARLLIIRNIKSAEEAHAFLHPVAEQLHDPYLLPDMSVAVERLERAVEDGEKILVHGDYDADGLTATALLVQWLSLLGADTDYFIPNRLDEGYGLKKDGVDHAVATGARLIITCDCGITSVDEVAYATEKGVEVIVTDHHEPDDRLPEALALINPKRRDSEYPFQGLAGVGVAGKLILALLERLNRDIPLPSILRICAIGTIADMVPLTDENRFIAHHGLASLPGTPSIGLRELMRESGLNGGHISSSDIGFRLAPRLNATGRFGKHDLAMELLFTKDQKKAIQLARDMNLLNEKRQAMVERMVEQAFEIVEGSAEYQTNRVLVLGRADWHRGLVGLVASRLVERYGKPALVAAFEDETATGSGRSIPAFNLVENLHAAASLFTRFGGHAMAAGFELPVSKMKELRQTMNDAARRLLSAEDLVPALHADLEIYIDELDEAFAEQYKLLEPFGYGNDAPLFLLRRLQLVAKPRILKQKHLKLIVKQAGGRRSVTVLYWRMAERLDELIEMQTFDALCSVSFNRWQEKEELQLTMHDFGRS